MSHDVFISHSAHDKEVANAVCHRMEEAGIRCWIAPRDVRAGEAWDDAIVTALAGTQIVVLVFSAAADKSRAVRNEIVNALDAGKIVFPFRIEDIAPSGGLQFHLSRVHWLDAMSPPLEAHIDNLVENAKRQLGQPVAERVLPPRPPPPQPAPPAPPRPVPAPKPRNTAAIAIGIAGGVALLIAAGLAGYVWTQKREPPSVAPVTIPPAAVPAAPAPVPTPPASAPAPAPTSPPAAVAPMPSAPSSEGFVIADSDKRLLSGGDLAGLSCGELDIARNEIYARRGRYFQRADLQNYFGKFPWYRPNSWNPDLNPTEKSNIAAITAAESRAGCR